MWSRERVYELTDVYAQHVHAGPFNLKPSYGFDEDSKNEGFLRRFIHGRDLDHEQKLSLIKEFKKDTRNNRNNLVTYLCEIFPAERVDDVEVSKWLDEIDSLKAMINECLFQSRNSVSYAIRCLGSSASTSNLSRFIASSKLDGGNRSYLRNRLLNSFNESLDLFDQIISVINSLRGRDDDKAYLEMINMYEIRYQVVKKLQWLDVSVPMQGRLISEVRDYCSIMLECEKPLLSYYANRPNLKGRSGASQLRIDDIDLDNLKASIMFDPTLDPLEIHGLMKAVKAMEDVYKSTAMTGIELIGIVKDLDILSKKIAVIREKIVKAYLFDVIDQTFKYIDSGLDPLDLIQEGNAGLVEAINSYDMQCDENLSEYVLSKIQIRLSTYIKKNTEQQGVHLDDMRLSLELHASVLNCQQPDSISSTYLVCDTHNITVNGLEKKLQFSRSAVSLFDVELAGKSLGDTVRDDSIIPCEIQRRNRIREYIVSLALTNLSKIQLTIVKQRYGFYNYECRTLDQIGYFVGISRERVRQIELLALHKLREEAKIGVFRWYLDNLEVMYYLDKYDDLQRY